MTVLLVPALDPDDRLPALLAAVRRLDPTIDLLVVDDGSAPTPVFDSCRALGATVLHHGVNRGKGAALRTGLAHVALLHPDAGVVTADADGQHLPADVLAVAARLATPPDPPPPGDPSCPTEPQKPPFLGDGSCGTEPQKGRLLGDGPCPTEPQEGRFLGSGVVLGVRSFTGDDVPLRSRVGNRVSALLVRAATGRALADTQTGLRGFTADLVPWLLTVRGDRFEYELRVLLEAARRGTPVEQVPIATVYLAGNSSSHFRAVRDSLRVYRPLALFLLSSLSAAVVDLVVLVALSALTGTLWTSVVGARLVSGTVNYSVNRRVVFQADRSRRSLYGYVALAGSLLLANLALISGFTALGMGLLAAKLVTELALVTISFAVQRGAVFRRRRARSAPGVTHVRRTAGAGSVTDG